MVRFVCRGAFRSDEDGGAVGEGLAVFPIMVLAVSACVEFGFMLHQWNLAAKAMQMGVRKLVVTEPVTSDFYQVFAFNDDINGDLIAANSGVTSSCGASTGATCDETIMQRIVSGGAGNAWPGLNGFFPDLEIDDIRVTYEQSGLGYHGRPGGPVVTVRMEIERDASDLPVTRRLLDLLNISFPPFAVTATSEDLQSCPGGCGAG